eukprot:2095307-Rhodomonas_salina.1
MDSSSSALCSTCCGRGYAQEQPRSQYCYHRVVALPVSVQRLRLCPLSSSAENCDAEPAVLQPCSGTSLTRNLKRRGSGALWKPAAGLTEHKAAALLSQPHSQRRYPAVMIVEGRAGLPVARACQ